MPLPISISCYPWSGSYQSEPWLL